MLDDAVAAFLEVVPERAFDEPLMALLRAEGFSDVTFTHGPNEFGKDIVARRDGRQWAFQSKAGNITQQGWRNLRGQLDELRTSDYGGLELDPGLPREAVLVTTGRLVGNAPLAAQEYDRKAREKGEPGLSIWSRDKLVARLSGNPDAALRGSVDGGLMTMLGAIDEGKATMDLVEQFARRWDDFAASQLGGRGVIEAGIVGSRLQQATRLDLACQVALCLVRASWANGQVEREEALVTADAGGALFEAFALELWAECGDELLRKRGLDGVGGPTAWAVYPVTCNRLVEILGLLVIRLAKNGDPAVSAISEWLAKFVYAQPGSSRLLGDRYAVSLIPPVLVLSVTKPRAAQKLLREMTVWVCDRYEQGADGLAPWSATPAEEIDRAFGGAFEHIRLRGRRTVSHAASIALDLAALCRFRRLYADIRNDHLAVGLTPVVMRCPDAVDQFTIVGEANRWEMNPDYPDELPHKGRLGTASHGEIDQPRRLVREGRSWDMLAVSAALRNRHFLDAMASSRADLAAADD